MKQWVKWYIERHVSNVTGLYIQLALCFVSCGMAMTCVSLLPFSHIALAWDPGSIKRTINPAAVTKLSYEEHILIFHIDSVNQNNSTKTKQSKTNQSWCPQSLNRHIFPDKTSQHYLLFDCLCKRYLWVTSLPDQMTYLSAYIPSQWNIIPLYPKHNASLCRMYHLHTHYVMCLYAELVNVLSVLWNLINCISIVCEDLPPNRPTIDICTWRVIVRPQSRGFVIVTLVYWPQTDISRHPYHWKRGARDMTE